MKVFPGGNKIFGDNLKTHSGEKSNKCNQCNYESSQDATNILGDKLHQKMDSIAFTQVDVDDHHDHDEYIDFDHDHDEKIMLIMIMKTTMKLMMKMMMTICCHRSG